MTPTEIMELKEKVRNRDGRKCVDCGMDEKEQRRRRLVGLNVHRLISGSVYSLEGCVTLCSRCHARRHRHKNLKTIDPLAVEFADKVILPLRKKKKWRREALAVHLGRSTSLVVSCENGYRLPKRYDQLRMIKWLNESNVAS